MCQFDCLIILVFEYLRLKKIVFEKLRFHLTVITQTSAGTISGVKRPRDVVTLESYESDAEYEVDANGVVVVRKTGSPLKKKQSIDGKRFVHIRKSNLCIDDVSL
jgi:hypothetical protein